MHFVLDETILHRLVGDRIVMHGQMRKLLQTTEQPNVTVQVLPRDVGDRRGRQWTLRFGILTQRALPRQESAELIAEEMRSFR